MRPVSAAEVISVLTKDFGFQYARTRGSHIALKRHTPQGTIVCVVPNHKELAVGTLRSVLRQAHISPAEFEVRLR